MKKCKHLNQVTINEIYGGYNEPSGLVEFDIICKDCGEIIGHWAYGSYDNDYILHFKLKGFKKLKYIIKTKLEDIKFRYKYRHVIKENKDDLPF